MESVTGMFGSLTSMPFDWLILGGIVVVIALDALRTGLGRAVTLSLALPIAYVLHQLAQTAYVIGGEGGMLQQPLAQGALFGVLFVVVYITISRMAFDAFDYGQPVQSILAGFAVAIVFTCVWMSVSVLGNWWEPGGLFQMLFAPAYRLFWLLGAFGALAFARG